MVRETRASTTAVVQHEALLPEREREVATLDALLRAGGRARRAWRWSRE
jgi:hypothetical protein